MSQNLLNESLWPSYILTNLAYTKERYLELFNKEDKSIFEKIKIWWYKNIDIPLAKRSLNKVYKFYYDSVFNKDTVYNVTYAFIEFYYKLFLMENEYKTFNDFMKSMMANPDNITVNTIYFDNNDNTSFSNLRNIKIIMKGRYEEGVSQFYLKKCYLNKLDFDLNERRMNVSLKVYNCDDLSKTSTADIVFNNTMNLIEDEFDTPEYMYKLDPSIKTGDKQMFSSLIAVILSFMISVFKSSTDKMMEDL